MRRINFLILALFATVAFAACSDDDDKEEEKSYCTVDQTPEADDCIDFCENPENAEHENCVEDVFVTPDPATDLCTGQETEYEAIEDITGIATDAAFACGATDVDATNEAEVEELNACVSLGIANKEGVGITAECAYCTAQVVSCTVANCIGACAADSGSDECLACQDENGCNDGYDDCQGLTAEEAPVACEEGQTPEADNCIDCEVDTEHEACQEEVAPVACEGEQTPEQNNCIDCEVDTEHEACQTAP